MFKLTKKVIASALAVISLASPVGAFNITQEETVQLNNWIRQDHAAIDANFRGNWRQEVRNVLLNRVNRVNTKYLNAIIKAINNNCLGSCDRFSNENIGFNYLGIVNSLNWQQFNIAECRGLLNNILRFLQLNDDLDLVDVITCISAENELMYKALSLLYLADQDDTIWSLTIGYAKKNMDLTKYINAKKRVLRNNAYFRGSDGQDVVVDAEGLRQAAIELLTFNINEIDIRLNPQH